MKATNLLPFLFAFFFVNSLISQSNIQQSLSVNSSGSAADASAQLDVSATDKGMLVPRMTSAQRTAIASPATGLLVFDTTTGGFWVYTGSAWRALSAILVDADGDTKVQVEKNPDEDIIRFDLGGTESLVLRKNAGGMPRLELPNALSNTFLGTNAGQANTTGVQNTAYGYAALSSNTTGFQNTAYGYAALSSNTTGFYNTATGRTAMAFNTVGTFNNAYGYGSLFSNDSGSNNTANGGSALFSNTTGGSNTANGYNALFSNITGSNNTALGFGADVTTGALTNATAIGYNAKVGASNSLVLGGTGADAVNVGVGTTTPNASALLDLTSTNRGMLVPRMTSAQRTAIASPATGLLVFDTTTGGFWVYTGSAWRALSAILVDADGDTKVQVEKNPDEDIIRFDLAGTESMVLRKNAGGTARLELPSPMSNTFIGTNAGLANTSGNYNTAQGNSALTLNTTGTQNTANGYFALFSNTTGIQNAALGNGALSTNSTGAGNAAVGMQALTGNTTGNENTATGSFTLFSNTTGHSNTGIGSQALFANSTGKWNTAAGHSSLFSNTTGFSNVALGKDALYSNTDRSNLVAVGDSALYNNGVGASISYEAKWNTAVGSKALFSNTTGNNNTANGGSALNSNTTGVRNTANGVNALFSNTTGSDNTANGVGALFLNTTGSDNTANGRGALSNNTTGSNNTANGLFALLNNVTGSNNTALGNNANVTANNLTNATTIGNAASVNASDKIRIGNTSVTVIEGQVDWTFPSDARFKFNIHDDQVPGLAFINQLRPVTYQFDTRKFDEHLMQNMPDSMQQRRMEGQDYSKSTATVQTGFLAQEVEQVCKKLGFEFSGLHVPESEVDNYGLAYGSFVPLLVKGMQEQQSLLRDLGAEIEAQKSEIHESKLEIEKLKKLETENAALKSQLDKITAALSGAGITVEK